jgi:hypothetical protein
LQMVKPLFLHGNPNVYYPMKWANPDMWMRLS